MPDCLFSDSSTSWDLDGVANYERLLAMTAFARRQRSWSMTFEPTVTREGRNANGAGTVSPARCLRACRRRTSVGGVALCPRSSRADRKRKGYGAVAPQARSSAGFVESRLTPVRLLPDSDDSPLSVSCVRRSERPMPTRRQLSSHPGSTSEISLLLPVRVPLEPVRTQKLYRAVTIVTIV